MYRNKFFNVPVLKINLNLIYRYILYVFFNLSRLFYYQSIDRLIDWSISAV